MLFSTATPILSLTTGGRAFQVSPATLFSWGLSKLRDDKHDPNCSCKVCKFDQLKKFQSEEAELIWEEQRCCLEDNPIPALTDTEVVYWDQWFMNAFPHIYKYVEYESGPMFLINSLSQASPSCLGITMLAYLEANKDELTDAQNDWLYEFYTTNCSPDHDYLGVVMELAQVK